MQCFNFTSPSCYILKPMYYLRHFYQWHGMCLWVTVVCSRFWGGMWFMMLKIDNNYIILGTNIFELMNKYQNIKHLMTFFFTSSVRQMNQLKTVFKIIGIENIKGLNMAQHFCYSKFEQLWHDTCNFLPLKFVYKISCKCHLQN